MTLNASILAKKHKIMPGKKSVTYYQQDGSGGFDSGTALKRAEKRPPTQDEVLAVSTRMDRQVVAWIVWNDDLGATPAPGDKINDGSNDWYVKNVTDELLQQRHRCLTVKGVS